MDDRIITRLQSKRMERDSADPKPDSLLAGVVDPEASSYSSSEMDGSEAQTGGVSRELEAALALIEKYKDENDIMRRKLSDITTRLNELSTRVDDQNQTNRNESEAILDLPMESQSSTGTRSSVASQGMMSFLKTAKALNLEFSNGNDANLATFLRDTSELMIDLKLSDREKLRCMKSCLKGEALAYAVGRNYDTYEGLESGLKDKFRPVHIQRAKRLTLMASTQRADETMSSFISRILIGNQNLDSPIGESELIEILVNNMAPYYKKALAVSVNTFGSLSALELAGTKADELSKAERSLRTLKGKTNFSKGQKTNSVLAVNEGASTSKSSSSGQLGKTDSSCFYCLKKGHYKRDCIKLKGDRSKGIFRRNVEEVNKISSQTTSGGADTSKSRESNVNMVDSESSVRSAIDGASDVVYQIKNGVPDELVDLRICIATEKGQDTRPYVIAYFTEDIRLMSLVDSGAQINLIHSAWSDRIVEAQGAQLFSSPKVALTANGQRLAMRGYAKLEFRIKGKSFNSCFWFVDNLAVPVLIGSEALRTMGATMDFKRDKLVISDRTGSISVDTFLCPTTGDHKVNFVGTYIEDIESEGSVNVIEMPDGTKLSLECQDSIDELLNKDFELADESWKPPEVKQDSWHADNTNLSEPDKVMVEAFVHKWQDKFRYNTGIISGFEADIKLKADTTPWRCLPYKCGYNEGRLLEIEARRLVDAGYIVENPQARYISPAFTVKKNSGKPGSSEDRRLVIDYKELNKRVERINSALPDMKDIILSLENKDYFTVIDCKDSFSQVKLSLQSQQYMSFVLGNGVVYSPVTLRQGFADSSSLFSEALRQVIGDLDSEPYLRRFVDDITVASTGTLEQHLYEVEQVLKRMHERNMQINFDKVRVACDRVEILGHEVTSRSLGSTLRPKASKCVALKNICRPKNQKGVRQLLGFVNFYSRFFQNLSISLAPFHHLLRKDTPFVWNEEQENAFLKLKEQMADVPLLHLPDKEKPLCIMVDSSRQGTGSVLYQEDSEKKIKVIEFYSSRFNAAVSNSSASVLEITGLLKSLEHWSEYCKWSKFPVHVYCDHRNIAYLFNSRSLECKLSRYRMRLSQYDLVIKYKPAAGVQPADFLSRTLSEEEDREAVMSVSNTSIISEDILEACRKSNDLGYRLLKENIIKMRSNFTEFKILDDVVYKLVRSEVVDEGVYKVYIPGDVRLSVLEKYHLSVFGCHLGYRKTMSAIQAGGYYFPSMRNYVQRFVKSCDSCQRNKNIQSGAVPELNPREFKYLQSGQVYFIDTVGPLPKSQGKQYYVSFLDDCSRYLVVEAVAKISSEAVIKALTKRIILTSGTPSMIITDRGSEYNSKLFKDFCERFGIIHRLLPAYSPKLNSVERSHRSISEMLRASISRQKDWCALIDYVVFNLNNVKSDLTGISPSMLFYGRQGRRPFDVSTGIDSSSQVRLDSKDYHSNLVEQQRILFQKAKTKVDKNRNRFTNKHNLRAKPLCYKLGDLVLKRTHYKSDKSVGFAKKLAPRYCGPFEVSKVLTNQIYELNTLAGTHDSVQHSDNLKPYFEWTGDEL